MTLRITIPQGTGLTVGGEITTYSGLLAEIGFWLNRSDLTERIPVFVKLLESRLNRILRVPEMEATETFSTEATHDFPTDFLELINLYLDSDPRVDLEAVSLDTLRTKYNLQTTGQPQAFSLSNGTIIFGPAPDSTYSAVLTYYKKIPALSSDNETNWLISSHPDVYLWGALCMAELYIWDDPRVGMWKAAWDEALNELKTDQGNRKRYGASPLRIRSPVSE